MEHPSQSPAPPPARPAGRGRLMLRVSVLILSLLLLAVLLLLVLSNKSKRQFTWMTSDQFVKSLHPGPPNLMDKLQNTVASALDRFHTNHPQILINSGVMTLSTNATALTKLGAPAYTNSDGARAWVLSPAELTAFKQQLKADPGVDYISAPRIQTENGMSAGITMGRSVPVAPGLYTNVGLGFDLLTKSSRSSVNLLLRATSTELAWPQTNGQVAIKTNFFVACRVFVPDTGAVVIDCGRTIASGQPNYWLIVSPVLIDARGIPIKR